MKCWWDQINKVGGCLFTFIQTTAKIVLARGKVSARREQENWKAYCCFPTDFFLQILVFRSRWKVDSDWERRRWRRHDLMWWFDPGWWPVLTKAALSFSSSRHGKQNITRGSWVDIRIWRDHKLITAMGKTDLTYWNWLNLLAIKIRVG